MYILIFIYSDLLIILSDFFKFSNINKSILLVHLMLNIINHILQSPGNSDHPLIMLITIIKSNSISIFLIYLSQYHKIPINWFYSYMNNKLVLSLPTYYFHFFLWTSVSTPICRTWTSNWYILFLIKTSSFPSLLWGGKFPQYNLQKFQKFHDR